jgi:hypothetical protein
LFGVANAAGGFHADTDAGLEKIIANGFEHHERHRHGRRGLNFAGAGFDEISASFHRQPACETDVIIGDQLAGFQNHFEMRRTAGLFHGRDFIKHFRAVSRQERGAVDHHIDFIRAISHSAAGFFETGTKGILAAGKAGGDRSDFHR